MKKRSTKELASLLAYIPKVGLCYLQPVFVTSIMFWMPESAFMKLGIYIMAAEPFWVT
jgi:hypothetical protein